MAKLNFVPHPGQVLLQPIEVKSKGLIQHTPVKAGAGEYITAKVVACTPTLSISMVGNSGEGDYEVGDTVYYMKVRTSEITIDGVDYYLIRSGDIAGRTERTKKDKK